MKRTAALLLLLVASSSLPAQTQNLISGKYSLQELKKVLIPQAEWTPFPRINDRAAWSKADQTMMNSYVAKAETYLNYDWPSIPATTSLMIVRTGDRLVYQAVTFKKREVLGILLLAEIAENKGRFMDAIINGVWSICEESFWGIPAHLPQTKEYAGLMDVTEPFVDLFVAETATNLAWVDYFLGEKLDAVSPQLRKRIYFETNKRVFEPLLTKAHWWMQADAGGKRPNNWNPWICSNWINTVLLLEKDDEKRTKQVGKALTVLDAFLNPHPLDGGCDEGPSYWSAAAASLYDNISLLNLASNDAFRYVYKDEKVSNMGKFIYRAQIGPKYFLNFADADPQPGLSGNMIYRYGKDIGDKDMMKFGAYYRAPQEKEYPSFQFFRNFFSLFMQDELQKAEQGLPLPQDVWLPDLQVMAARDFNGNTKGFYMAAKGGHNDESHNHNDVGNFVVYYDGLPLLIDVGRGTYTLKTFSAKRYDLWFNCSDYHNLPTINDKTQPPGPQFKAASVLYQHDKGTARLSLDISKAYPDDAGIVRFQRTILLNRTKNVRLEDAITLKQAGEVTEHLMTCYPVELTSPGELVIHYKPEGGTARDFRVRYNKDQLEAAVEKVVLNQPEDQAVIEHWGDSVYRLNFKTRRAVTNDKINFEISR